MKINITRIDQDFGMEAVNEQGNRLIMDGSPEIGGHNLGMRPMQLLLCGIGGCSAIDIILILKKQKQTIDSFEIEVEGDRTEMGGYSLFTQVNLIFRIKGNVDIEKAERAAALSIEKYCSVAKTLEPHAKINYRISVNEMTQ